MIPLFRVNMSPVVGEDLSKVLTSGYIGQGHKVDQFERILQTTLDYEYGVTVNSATSALWLACHLIDIGPGDFVISSPMTCSATNEVLALRGAHIIWADVDAYGNMLPMDIALKLNNKNVKAIVATDWGGLPNDYRSLKIIADKGGVPIIEDAAHAFMATFDGESLSKAGASYIAYSFQAIKHLTTGDGGLLVVPPEQYERAKLLRWYGLDRTKGDSFRCKQDIIEAGYKFHMNDINATIGIANVHKAAMAVHAARKQAKIYDKELKEFRPDWPQDRESAYWLYTIHVPYPDEFERFMSGRGIAVSQVHNRNDKFSCFSKFKAELPYLDKWFSTMVCIPIGWWVTEQDQEYIIKSIREYVKTVE